MRAPVCKQDQETMRVVLEAVRDGKDTRPKLMAVECIRHLSWARVGDALANLVRERQLIATKHGWRLP